MTANYDEKTVEYYNKNAKEYFDNTININMESLYSPFLELMPPRGKILDAGCGSGRDSLYFKKRGYEVVGIDASEKLAKLASTVLGKPILNISFRELEFQDEFDGIWACGSLLHVPKNEIGEVIIRLSNALRKNGVIYASFKYGIGERLQDGRIFNDYEEETFSSFMQGYSSLKLVKIWKTEDVRRERQGEYWLNALIRKV